MYCLLPSSNIPPYRYRILCFTARPGLILGHGVNVPTFTSSNTALEVFGAGPTVIYKQYSNQEIKFNKVIINEYKVVDSITILHSLLWLIMVIITVKIPSSSVVVTFSSTISSSTAIDSSSSSIPFSFLLFFRSSCSSFWLTVTNNAIKFENMIYGSNIWNIFSFYARCNIWLILPLCHWYFSKFNATKSLKNIPLSSSSLSSSS